MLEYLSEHDGDEPWFAFVPYTAPHWPLQAKPEDVKKYEGRYVVGWDTIRAARYARQREIGIVPWIGGFATYGAMLFVHQWWIASPFPF